MKKLFILTVFILSITIGSPAEAQIAPPGAGDKDLRDNNVKSRSIEIERVERDARKNNNAAAGKSSAENGEDRLAVKYTEIKIVYEQIQLSQDAVVKTYRAAGKIDYAQIAKSALEINGGAARLNANLFPAAPVEINEENKDGKGEEIETKEKPTAPAKRVRDLVVALDNAVGDFATSPMFQNLRLVDAAVSGKAKSALEKIIELSDMLTREAGKIAAKQ